jgi:epsilon-lactone hydrolase
VISKELRGLLARARDAVPAAIGDRLDLAGYRQSIGSLSVPMPRAAQVVEVVAAEIPVRWIIAANADSNRRILYLHGGGFVAGNLSSHAAIAAWISEYSKCAVLIPEYRLAPEHPYPAALDDAVNAYQWMCSHGPNEPSLASQSFVVGDSAGGGLAISVALRLLDAGDPVPHAGVSICPWLNLDPASSFALQKYNMLREIADAYAGGTPRTSALLSPVYARLERLPPWLVQVGTGDLIYGDGVAILQRAFECGARFSFDVWPDLPHVWHKYGSLAPESREAIETIASFLNRTPHSER